MTKRLNALGMLLALALTAGGCAATQAFRQGEAQMRAGNLDEAVAAYRKAVQAAPDNANYKIAMSRALIAASRAHLEKAREFEAKDQLEAALGEYKLASEYDPSNRVATAKVAELDRTIRERIEASRPKPPIVAMREPTDDMLEAGAFYFTSNGDAGPTLDSERNLARSTYRAMLETALKD
jgi:general secretion pathway protein D